MKIKRETVKEKQRLNVLFVISCLLFTVSLFVLFLSIISTRFAEFYSNTVSHALRYFISYLTGFFNFSLFEIILLFTPLILFFTIVCIFKRIKYKLFSIVDFLKMTGCMVFTLFFLFVNLFGVCYFRCPIETHLEIERKTLSRKEVYETALFVKEKVELYCNRAEFDRNTGASVNPYDWDEMNNIIDKGYKIISEKYPFISEINAKSKWIILSPLMTYTHLSGIYIPFTSEANVNYNYPDYITSFSMAHEKAHQRGIAGEDEANFVAFLACINSGDDYMMYSAYMNIYDYFLDSLIEKDIEMYKWLVDHTDEIILKEMYSYYVFFKKYSDSSVSKTADAVNDAFIKTMGDEDGTNSYGNVVELFYAYKEKGLLS